MVDEEASCPVVCTVDVSSNHGVNWSSPLLRLLKVSFASSFSPGLKLKFRFGPSVSFHSVKKGPPAGADLQGTLHLITSITIDIE